jgi:hypothetical protein
MEKLNINIDKQELMTYFRQGVASQTQVLPSMAQVPNAHELTLQDRRHDILSFVSRPIDVFKGIWTTNQGQNAELIPAGLIFPDLLYKNPQYQEKMRGFVGLRGRIRIRLIINAQKFQQGILMAYWIPNYKNLLSKAALIQASLAGKSGCAHVFINCEGGTEQSIDIPYVNQHTYYNSVTDQGNYGALFLCVFGQLKSETSDDVGLRIQAWLDGPELEYPTAVMPVLTQGSEEESMHLTTADVPNGGSEITLNDIMKEIKNFSLKPSYLARNAANLMQLAGHQKPTNITGITRSSLRTNSYMANFGGEQMSHKLALAANNELLSMPEAGGSTSDEMNLINICKVPCYYKTFSVNVTDPENKVLFSDNVHPAKFVQTGTEGVMNSTFLGIGTACFGQWRGSMKYTFICAKTGFHSGTLRVSWVPGLYAPFDDPSTIPSGINLDRCYQETYDLRDMTEFSFTVPYTSTREFLNVINEFSVQEQSVKKHNYSTGVIVVDIFVPLRAPETVTQNFDIMVLVGGGDDIILANPTAPNIYPYTVATQGISMDEQHDRQDAVQSVDQPIGAAHLKMSLTPSALCTGEVITSIKNLLARAGTYYLGDVTNMNIAYTIAPFDFQAPRTKANLDTPFPFDYIDFFSYIYAFYRGGIRLSMDPGMSGAYQNLSFVAKMRSTLNNYYPLTDIPRGTSSTFDALPKQFLYSPFSTQVMKPGIEGMMDLEAPFYSLSHVTPVLVQEQTQNQVEESNYPFPIVTIYPSGEAKNLTARMQPTFYRSCADDFCFQYLLGPPQVHFINYTIIPFTDGTQFFDVDYSSQPVTRVGNSANGLFGQAFTFGILPTASQLYVPNQFLATNAGNGYIFALPEDTYSFAWTSTGNHLQVVLNPYNPPSVPLWMFSNKVGTAGNIVEAWTKYAIVPPVSGAQALPKPCCSWESETITVSGSSVDVPSWGLGAITYMVNFVLPHPILVAKTNTGTVNAFSELILIDAGRTLRIMLNGPPGSTSLDIYSASSILIGHLIITLDTNSGFSNTNPSFSPTAVSEYNFPA